MKDEPRLSIFFLGANRGSETFTAGWSETSTKDKRERIFIIDDHERQMTFVFCRSLLSGSGYFRPQSLVTCSTLSRYGTWCTNPGHTLGAATIAWRTSWWNDYNLPCKMSFASILCLQLWRRSFSWNSTGRLCYVFSGTRKTWWYHWPLCTPLWRLSVCRFPHIIL